MAYADVAVPLTNVRAGKLRKSRSVTAANQV